MKRSAGHDDLQAPTLPGPKMRNVAHSYGNEDRGCWMMIGEHSVNSLDAGHLDQLKYIINFASNLLTPHQDNTSR